MFWKDKIYFLATILSEINFSFFLIYCTIRLFIDLISVLQRAENFSPQFWSSLPRKQYSRKHWPRGKMYFTRYEEPVRNCRDLLNNVMSRWSNGTLKSERLNVLACIYRLVLASWVWGLQIAHPKKAFRTTDCIIPVLLNDHGIVHKITAGSNLSHVFSFALLLPVRTVLGKKVLAINLFLL